MARISRTTPSPAAWAYAWWLLVGALLSLGGAALLTIGLAFLLVGGVLALVGLRTRSLRNSSAVAAVAGFGVPALYLAWLNRGGPSVVCQTTTTETSCGQAWSPWPFGAFAVLAVAISVFLGWRTRR